MAMSIMVLFLLVLVPLIAGAIMVILSRDRGSRAYPSCGGCGYDVSGTVGTATRCPECGKEFLHVGINPPGGRRNKALLWLGLAFMILPLTCFISLAGIGYISSLRSAGARQAAVQAQTQTQQSATQPATAEPEP